MTLISRQPNMHSYTNKDFYMTNPLGIHSSPVKKGTLCKPIISNTFNKTLTKPNSVQKTLLHSTYEEHKCRIQHGVHKYPKNLEATSKFQALQK